MNFKKLNLLFFILIAATIANAEIPIVLLKGMTSSALKPDSGVKQPYVQFSPAIGALYWKSPFLENMYIYGPKDDQLTQLIMQLFHVHVDGSFDTTRSYTSIAKYFDGVTIGNLVGLLATIEKEEKNEIFWNNLPARIETEILNPLKLQSFTAIKKGLEIGFSETMNRHKKNIEIVQAKLAEGTQYQQLMTELRQKRAQLEAVSDELKKVAESKPKEKKVIESFIDQVKKMGDKWLAIPEPSQLDALNRATEKFKEMTKKVIARDGNAIMQAFEELKNTIMALSNLPTLKEIKKGEEELVKIPKLIERELHHRQNEIDNKDEIVSEDFRASIPALAILLTNAFKKELEGSYPQGTLINTLLAFLWKKAGTIDDLRLCLDTLASKLAIAPSDLYSWPTPMLEYDKGDYEKLKGLTDATQISQLSVDDWIFARFGFDLYDNIVPLKVGMIDTAHYKGRPFSDCGETSLRNLLNAICYNNIKAHFDNIILKNLGAIGDVLKYYSDYYGTAYIMTNKAHDDWAAIVSGLPDVKYSNPDGCDIDSGISNMMNVINNLFPGIKSFEKLQEKLLDVGITMTFESSYPIATNNMKNVVKITIKKPYSNAFTLDWQFEPGHFEIYFPVALPLGFAPTYREALNQGEKTLVKAYLIAAFDASYDDLREFPIIAKAGDFCLYLSPLYNDRQKIAAVEQILRKAPQEKDQDFIKELYQRMRHKEKSIQGFMNSFLTAIKKLEEQAPKDVAVHPNFDAINKIKQLQRAIFNMTRDSEGTSNAIRFILEKKLAEQFGAAISMQGIDQIIGDDALDLIDDLLERNIGTGPEQPFMEKLFSWKITPKTLQTFDAKDCQELLEKLLTVPYPLEPKKREFVERLYDIVIAPEFLQKLQGHGLYKLFTSGSPIFPVEGAQPKQVLLFEKLSAPEFLQKLSGKELYHLLDLSQEYVGERYQPQKVFLLAKLSVPEFLQKLSGQELYYLLLSSITYSREQAQPQKTFLISKISSVPEVLQKLSGRELYDLLFAALSYTGELDLSTKVFLIEKLSLPELLQKIPDDKLYELLLHLLLRIDEARHPQKASLIVSLSAPELLQKLSGLDLVKLLYLLPQIDEATQPKKAVFIEMVSAPEILKKIPDDKLADLLIALFQKTDEVTQPKKAILIEKLSTPLVLRKLSRNVRAFNGLFSLLLRIDEAAQPKKATVMLIIAAPDFLNRLGDSLIAGLIVAILKAPRLIESEHPKRTSAIREIASPEQIKILDIKNFEALSKTIKSLGPVDEIAEPVKAKIIKDIQERAAEISKS